MSIPRRLAVVLVASVLAAAGVVTEGSLTAPPAGAATAAPKQLHVVSRSTSAVAVSWSAIARAPKYRIQLSRSASMKHPSYQRFAGTSAELTGLRSGTTYYVKVRAITAAGKNLTPYSTAVKVATRSKSSSYRYLSPAGLRATSDSPTSITLGWSSRGSGIRYRVQYSRSSSMAHPTYVRSTRPSVSIEKLRPGTTYWFKVRVITSGGTNRSEYSRAVKVSTRPAAASRPLRVGSYNIRCSNCFAGEPNELTWQGRRNAVASTIKGADLDVVGLQEAGQAWLKDAAGKSVDQSQFEDLLARLGGSWRLTNTKRNNCVKDTTPTKCVHADKGASKGTRIAYDASKLELLSAGSKRLSYDKAESSERFVAWAVLRQRSTGHKFFFADAHLEPAADPAGSRLFYDLRRRQAADVVATVKARNTARLPVIVVGDFNSHKWTVPGNGPYDVFGKAGLVDPLGNTYESTKTATGATVGRRVRTTLNSFNGFARVAPNHPSWVNGTYIDYIMTSRLPVAEWETVARLDSAGRFVGVIPSDHNLIRATVSLR
ncbi:fibronectin type III domain-containing protein [Microlunatus ginsengisoli]|uniref:Fibronectin type-III domain-containing protein n=1 Tax=Microlunatus ginsengisoli TaxID=363863 RepID=A0ABP7AMV7_9ACTN